MRTRMRKQNRWLTAVAMTCMSGFALCGCTRGSRDVSSNLPESAAREALEAERHVAERKRSEMGAAKSKELLASKDGAASTRSERPSSKTELERSNRDDELDGLATLSPKKPSQTKKSFADSELETAEWAEDSTDQRVKTVSDEQEADDVEVAEPLLDSPKREPAATELFEDEPEASVRVKKPISKGSPPGSNANAATRGPRPNQASFDGASEHPWAKKSPGTTRSQIPEASTDRDDVTEEEAIVSSRRKATGQTPAEQVEQDDARQAEAKARIQVLVTQAKSLLNKGEYRPAYRVAQLAQRIADSEDLFFAAGEEQPADLVRAVLMKIRMEESNVASSSQEQSVAVEEDNPWNAEPANQVVKSVGRTQSNRPDDWAFAEWKEGRVRRSHPVEQTASVDNPWEAPSADTSSEPEMRIEPGPADRRGSRHRTEFPNSRPEWRSSSNAPLTLGRPLEEAPPEVASPSDGRISQVVQADLNANPGADTPADAHSLANGKTRVPRPFPSSAPLTIAIDRTPETLNAQSEPLASAENWRTQDLNDVTTSRAPLLIAPLPPDEPAMTDAVSDALEESFATDIVEPTQPHVASKLWMILAAAAGAFAMLFVRRRPVPSYRSGGEGR